VVHFSCLSSVLSVHRRIDAKLLDARLLLLAGYGVAAREALGAVGEHLAAHMAYEEELLLPAYEAACEVFPPHGAPELIRRDHRLIDAALVRCGQNMAAVGGASARALVAAHEALAALADLLEHHDQREAESFEPLLDEVLPAHIREGLLHAVASAEARFGGAWAPTAVLPMLHGEGFGDEPAVGEDLADEAAVARQLLLRIEVALATGQLARAHALVRRVVAVTALAASGGGASGGAPGAAKLALLAHRVAQVVESAGETRDERQRRLVLLRALEATARARRLAERL
jgi:hypothetical protein